ncbi:MAG: hypothetical protein IJR37_05995 [Schwartzia sp.]|jgi:hypothetical protein|nr:hypothetical protein [Schwartzia sp. (in: firmicutes)]
MSDNRRKREKGAAFLELIASMPLIAILLVALGTAFVFGVRAYLFLMSDWALQEQVGYAMERIVTDLRYAEEAKMEGNRLLIHCREIGAPLKWVEYERTNEAVPRIRLGDQPLTGQSTLGKIAMEDFHVEVGTQTVFVRIAGKNLLTDQSYALETMVTLKGKTP